MHGLLALRLIFHCLRPDFILATLCLGLSLVLFSLSRRRHPLPPGPRGVPILGNLLQLGIHPHLALQKLGKRYGSIFRVKLGSKLVVVLNETSLIRELFASPDLCARPDLQMIREIHGDNGGISLATGRKWKENRQFTIKALARLGVADRSVESRIVREVDSLLSVMATVDSHLFNPAVICSCIANVMCDIIFGRRYAHDDPEMMKYVAEMQEGFVLMAHLGILNFLPALRHLPMTRKPLARLNVTKAAAHSFFANHVREHMATFDPENIRDFIDTYLEEARKRAQVDANCNLLEDDYVLHLVGDLFGSGFVTTAHTIIWGLLYMSRHGDVQRRVQAEIGEQIGEGRAPNLADMSELPYTVAVVHEVLRFKTVAPLGVPHANTKDLVVRGYHIPKGTFIMPLLHAVHHSEMHWKNPTEFDPTNFLDSDGRLKIPSAFMPFSSGKRICPGGQLAMYETFLFLASILQRFTVTLPEGAPVPDLIGKLGVTLAPPTFDLLITAR